MSDEESPTEKWVGDIFKSAEAEKQARAEAAKAIEEERIVNHRAKAKAIENFILLLKPKVQEIVDAIRKEGYNSELVNGLQKDPESGEEFALQLRFEISTIKDLSSFSDPASILCLKGNIEKGQIEFTKQTANLNQIELQSINPDNQVAELKRVMHQVKKFVEDASRSIS